MQKYMVIWVAIDDDSDNESQIKPPKKVWFVEGTMQECKGPGHRELRGLETSYNNPNVAWLSPPKGRAIASGGNMNPPSPVCNNFEPISAVVVEISLGTSLNWWL